MEKRPTDWRENDQGVAWSPEDLQIVQAIKELPDLEPPRSLTPSVMEVIHRKRLPAWRRLYWWVTSPQRITVTPLRAFPVLASFVFVLVVASWLLLNRQVSGPIQLPGQERTQVVFTLGLSQARSVAVIGTFNGWNPRGFEMKFDEVQRIWSLSLSLPEGRHEYAYLVDGQTVIPDPETVFYQEDGFGNKNSVIILKQENGKDV